MKWHPRSSLAWLLWKLGDLLHRTGDRVFGRALLRPDDDGWFQDLNRRCRECGCDDLHACLQADGLPCHWLEDDLCSNCGLGGSDPVGTIRTELKIEADAFAQRSATLLEAVASARVT